MGKQALPVLNGKGKMSKSENKNATIYLADSDDEIRSKIKKAKTDVAPTEPNSTKPEAIENLFLLMSLVSSQDTVKKFGDDYNNCTIRFGDLKQQLAEDMVNFIRPIREKTEAIRNDHAYLEKVMKEGAAKARKSAAETMRLVKSAMGLDY